MVGIFNQCICILWLRLYIVVLSEKFRTFTGNNVRWHCWLFSLVFLIKNSVRQWIITAQFVWLRSKFSGWLIFFGCVSDRVATQREFAAPAVDTRDIMNRWSLKCAASNHSCPQINQDFNFKQPKLACFSHISFLTFSIILLRKRSETSENNKLPFSHV